MSGTRHHGWELSPLKRSRATRRRSQSSTTAEAAEVSKYPPSTAFAGRRRWFLSFASSRALQGTIRPEGETHGNRADSSAAVERRTSLSHRYACTSCVEAKVHDGGMAEPRKWRTVRQSLTR